MVSIITLRAVHNIDLIKVLKGISAHEDVVNDKYSCFLFVKEQ